MTRIVVDPPARDAHREQIERDVFAKLAAIDAAERADRAVPARPRWRHVLAMGGALAAAAAAVVLLVRGGDREPPAAAPSLVVTPVGGTSRFTVGDAVIDAGSDTSVEVRPGEAGAVTLVLARGSVDCDVAPRGNRPPFRVIAGDVTVTVVGTRFTVARRPQVRVDVARGKVEVAAPGGTTLVAAGESWPAVTASAEPPAAEPPAPPAAEPPEIAMDPAPAAKPHVSPAAAYRAAHELAATDPRKAAAAYRAVAAGGDRWAALALVDLAELHKDDPSAALHDLDEYARRFPHGANLEDVLWQRIELLRAAGRKADAHAAAADFVRRFPASVYVESAKRLAEP